MSAAASPLEAALKVETAADFAAVTGASEAQMADLEALRVLLVEWNARMNLVGPATLPAYWSRHAWDSAQLLHYAPTALTWADLGAGAGFPGLVLAVMLKGRPGAKVHLVESMAKRCRFLSEVIAALSLPAQVHNARAEALKLTVDVVTARAVAPLLKLLGYAQPYMARKAVGLFLKGLDVGVEIEEATKYWNFDPERLPSLSDPRGQVLRIERLSRAA